MLYKPDYKYKNGKDALKELSCPLADDIRYYVNEQLKHMDRQRIQIEEMVEVFNGIKRFTR